MSRPTASRDGSLRTTSEPALWPPFAPLSSSSPPLVIERADGVFLIDPAGRRYYDGNSSLWVNLHGHRHPRIDAAIRAQLERVAHITALGLTHPLAGALARRLVEITPAGLEHVFFSDDGSTAVEVALKMAFQYWQLRGEPLRTEFVALERGYHGDTLGAVSVGGVEAFHALFAPLTFTTHFAPSPALAGRDAALEALDRILATHGRRICAVILEPRVQAAGGMLVAPEGYLRGVGDLCRRHDALLIADEVATGFGRTGRMFACEHEGVTPDLMCLAKGLTGGYLPLAATLASAAIHDAFVPPAGERRVFYHGHSYTANPLGCAAALASLDVFREEDVLECLPAKIARVHQRLGAFGARPHVREVRQCGLMVGIELAEADGSAYPPERGMGARVCRRCTELGMITRPLGDVIVFMPPLAATEDDLDAMLDLLLQALIEVTAEAR